MNLLSVNDGTFEAEIRKHPVTMVEFGATWCPPCKVLLPILDELQEEHGEQVAILKVDCDESPGVTQTYGVMSMPTVILFRNGEPVEKLVGLRPKSVYENLIARISV